MTASKSTGGFSSVGEGEVTGFGGGFHFGFSVVGLGGGLAGPKPPLPCKAAMRSFKLMPCPILSLASAVDMELFAGVTRSLSLFDGEDGGEGCFGFHEMFPGLGRVGGGDDVLGVEDCFSKAAILSRSEPIFFGGGDSSAILLSSIIPEIDCEEVRELGGNGPSNLPHASSSYFARSIRIATSVPCVTFERTTAGT